jgi:tetratricopeptide (TPR) repeat protein
VQEDIARAISQRNLAGVLRLMFEGSPPRPRLGRNTETDLWDYKSDCPQLGKAHEGGWAHIAADVLGFYNLRGGLLIFGLDDKRYAFVGATRPLDSKKFNDQIRRYLGDVIWVDFHREYIQDDQRYLGIALIPPRGPAPARFKSSAPLIAGRRLFEAHGSALREGDSTRIMDPAAADRYMRSVAVPKYGEKYAVDEPCYRVLAPEYDDFLSRGGLGETLEKSLRDPRVAVTSLIGVGGIGKTALATWAALRAYDSRGFPFIVSTTAKDRELTSVGIMGLHAGLSSYEDLLDQITEVLGFPELRAEEIGERERSARLLLETTPGLLYVDNLETVDDMRLIAFLDDLPLGVKALVTSRRSSVRTAARPIDVPPFRDRELVQYIRLLARERTYKYLSTLSDTEAMILGRAWDGIPLAIRWGLSRTASVKEALSQAELQMTDRLHGEQLLEFTFRRVFEKLTNGGRAVLETVSVLERPIPTEAVIAGAGLPDHQVLDAVEDLLADAIVHRVFDELRNDYCFTTLPITRAFTRRDLARRPSAARAAQRRLSAWFEATDVTDSDERLVVRELRQGRGADDTALIDLATAAERRGDLDTAERLYRQALSRNPRSWKAARAAAEFYRHKRNNNLEALTLYRVAGAHAPVRGRERTRIFREWGLLLRDSGEPGAAKEAEEKLLAAHESDPADPIARYALAGLYDRRGAYRKVIELLEPIRTTQNPKTRQMSLPLLLKAYDKSRDIVKAAELRRELSVGSAD